jgi:ubiquinone/menaquinone biosynthesis C-methylase UbiE
VSSYAPYERIGADYDRTRSPTGQEIILGCLSMARTPLPQMTLLDAGCGTGNYVRALLDRVARVEAVDRSQRMLEVARAKLADAIATGRVGLHRASIDALPLADASVDGAMVNQVLHHLADRSSQGWPAHRRVLGELARVLRPGGVLVINTCSHAQTQDGHWAYHLIPHARAAVLERLMPLDAIEAALRDIRLEPRGRFVPVDAVLQGKDYFDPQGPLRAEWRAGDSIWALVGAGELAAVEDRLRELDRRGELDAYVRTHDARRQDIGQITILYAIKL